jgi:thermitase
MIQARTFAEYFRLLKENLVWFEILVCAFVGVFLATLSIANAAGIKGPRRPDVVLFEMKTGASVEELAAFNQIIEEFQIKTTQKLVNAKIHFARINRAQLLDEDQIAEALSQTGAVKYATADSMGFPDSVPNDPYYGYQWEHQVMNSPLAWDHTRGEGVIVTVCDDGFDEFHPDLRPNLLLPGFNTYDGTTNIVSGSHGTYVLGALGAVSNNEIGMSGMAGGAKMIPVRMNIPGSGAYISDVAECITYGANRGSRVVNISWHFADPNDINVGTRNYSPLDSAGAYLRSKGGLLFMSAGNQGVDTATCYPDFANIIFVGGTDSLDQRASYSNYGAAVDVFAPSDYVYITTPGGGYSPGRGTSFSSPIAAGVAALIFSVNPKFTPAQVESIMYSTTTDLGAVGEDNIYGHGRLNSGAAVEKAVALSGTSPTPAPTPVPTPIATPVPTPPPPVPASISLSVRAYKVKGQQKADLVWTGATSSSVDIYRNGSVIAVTANDGAHTDAINKKGGGSYIYKICESGTSVCSSQIIAAF